MRTSHVNVTAGKSASAVCPGVAWVSRGGWGKLPALTAVGDCNVWLIQGDEFDVLIDAGAPGPLTDLERNIRRVGGSPKRIAEIWLTHSHFDHLGKVRAWQDKYPGVRVRMSAIGADFLARKDLRLTGAPMIPHRRVVLPRRPASLYPGDVLECPPHRFTVVQLQGHTPDCVGFRGEGAGLDVMLTGDAIIGDQRAEKGGIGWLDGLWLSDIDLYEQTLRRVLTDPPQLILPGHGEPNVGAAARRSLRNCLERIRCLRAFPGLNFMLPVFAHEKPEYSQRRPAR